MKFQEPVDTFHLTPDPLLSPGKNNERIHSFSLLASPTFPLLLVVPPPLYLKSGERWLLIFSLRV